MHGFDLDAWGEYFVATAGVGAALAGLVFVGTLGSLAAGVFGAWVLLVEILR